MTQIEPDNSEVTLQKTEGQNPLPIDAVSEPAKAEDKASAELAVYLKAYAYLEAAAQGKIKVDLDDAVLSKVHRTSVYGDALLTYLSHHLGISKGRVVALALAFIARQLTNRTVTSQNELAVLLHGTQFAVHDLAIEVREFRELALAVADQESFTVDPVKS